MSKFCRFELRTTDADAARAFYTQLFGHDRAVVWPLHEQALARGARPHWLGSIGVDDVERAAAAFVERGARRLGPTIATRFEGQLAIVHDPSGAVLAVATPPPGNVETTVDVVWHVFNTNDVARAAETYRDLFGWEVSERVEESAHGPYRPFAWQAGGASVGAFTDITTRPAVHAHWLFFFATDALDAAMATTRAAGGLVLDPIVTSDGKRLCVCEDPQGAAFGLRER